MQHLGVVEDTLFVPLLGRIYATEHFPNILYDKVAASLADKIPREVTEQGHQTQYTLMASAVRAANMDRIAADFLKRKAHGVVVQLGCGLETAAQRCAGEQGRWYAVDLPEVIRYRERLIPAAPIETLVAADAFSPEWIERVRALDPNAPLLVTAAGLFHYFSERDVVGLLKMLTRYGDIEVAFDAVSKAGLAMMKGKYMKQVGHEEAAMGFYVDSAAQLADKVGARLVAEERYYARVPRSGLSLITNMSMGVSDALFMLKMIQLDMAA